MTMSPIGAETAVARALAGAYVHESGLLEDDPGRYVDAHRPHARAAIRAYERHRQDVFDDPAGPAMLRWCEWPGCLNSYNILTGPPPGPGSWVYVRTGAQVLLCPAHQDAGHRPQRPLWTAGAETMDVACQCGEHRTGHRPVSQRSMLDWWHHHVLTVTGDGTLD